MGENNDLQPKNEGSKNDFLLLLLRSIDEGVRIRKIAEISGRSKQDLNYHLRKFAKLRLISKEQSYPYSIYKLTPLGAKVKDSIIQSEHLRSKLWKAHNLITGFKIRSFGSFNFVETSNRKIVQMQNWRYAREELEGEVINIQNTGLLKIYCSEIYGEDPDVLFGKMYATSQRVAQFYVDRYGMILEPLHVIRKGEKSLMRSEVLGKIFGRVKTEELYINASEGTEELEAPQDSYAIEGILKLPDIIEHQLNPALQQFSENIKLHLEVLQEIRDAVRELRK